MKNEQIFMMIFKFTPNFEYQPTEEEKVEMKEDWGNFIGNMIVKEKLVSTHQLGFEGKRIAADKSVEEGIEVVEEKTIGGNMIVKANSLDEAVEMAKESPILKMGGSVEVRSITPMENE